jgi:3-oxoacyl-[acyl-carrier-protein] synthase-3
VSSCVRSVVTGVGSYLPERIVTNAEMATMTDTSDEWIVERTGIRERHYAAPDQGTSDLATAAARQALEAAGRTPADVDLIIVATTTPDLTFPAVAVLVQAKLGCPVGIAFDVQAVCSGFVYALNIVDGFVARGQAKCALVIGADRMSSMMNYADRTTCVLFGDGAGAVVIEPQAGQGTTADRGLLGFSLRADGNKEAMLRSSGGVSSTGDIGYLTMQGNQVFRHAVVNIAEAVGLAAQNAGIAVADVDWFIPHQANQRILDGVAQRLGLDEAKVVSTVAWHANTSAASIPLAFDVAVKDGRVQRGQLLLMEAMGGGLTWGAAVLRY